MAEVLEVTDATFETEVLAAGQPIVVDFWAPWCGPCRAVAPIIQELAADYGEHVLFAKLNIDESPAVATRFAVLSIPTLILFENGQAQNTVVGARPRTYFEEVWRPWLNAAA